MKPLLTFLDGIGSVGALLVATAVPWLLSALRGSHYYCRARHARKLRTLRSLCTSGLCAALLVWFGTRRSAAPQPLAARARRYQPRRFGVVFAWRVLSGRALWRLVRLARRDRLEPFVVALLPVRHA